MKRCMSPVSGRASRTSRRKTFRPQLWSCSQSPVIQPTSRLKTFEGSVLWSGSTRGDFQPFTRSAPSSSNASMLGISAGSSCPSPSSITIRGAALAAKPAANAADLPWPVSRWMPRMRGSAAEAAVISSQEVSVEPSSTTVTSHEWPAASSASRISASRGVMLPASLRAGMTRETEGVEGMWQVDPAGRSAVWGGGTGEALSAERIPSRPLRRPWRSAAF